MHTVSAVGQGLSGNLVGRFSEVLPEEFPTGVA